VNDIQAYVRRGAPKVVSSKNLLEILSTLAIPLFIEGHLKWIISLDSSRNNIYTNIDLTVAEYIREQSPIKTEQGDIFGGFSFGIAVYGVDGIKKSE